MTRSEFIENVQYWDDLMEMASEYDCEPLYDIHSKDELDTVVCNTIREEIHHSYWYDIRDRLSDIDVYEDYFLDKGCFDYDNLNDDTDFEEYKGRVLDWGDFNDIWDSEEGDYVDDDVFAEDSIPFTIGRSVCTPATVDIECQSFEPAPIADLIAML